VPSLDLSKVREDSESEEWMQGREIYFEGERKAKMMRVMNGRKK